MGFVGKIFKTIFSPDIPQAQEMQPTITAQQLVSSTSSATPNSPVMGADTKKKGSGGVSSLLVPSESLYKGGA